MVLTGREFWLMLHLGLGIAFIHGFGVSVKELLTGRASSWIKFSTVAIAVVCWLTVISGTYWVYSWYRMAPPTGADLSFYPRSYLLAQPSLSYWHKFGMEWKEHIGWLTPIISTTTAYVTLKYQTVLNHNSAMRKVILALLMIALIAAGLGAFINKVAPNTFLDLG